MSQELTPELLLSAYAQGMFPMSYDGEILWFDPDPRAILPLDDRFHISRSLRRTLKKDLFEIRVNTAFTAVIRACAAPAPGRNTTWIDDQIIAGYIRLHQLGFAHSVETWIDDKLVGGLYGVALNGLFAGESMFSREKDASKVALVSLVERLRQQRFLLLDTQFTTDHLLRFGAIEIPSYEYKQRLQAALERAVKF